MYKYIYTHTHADSHSLVYTKCMAAVGCSVQLWLRAANKIDILKIIYFEK